MTNLSDYMTKMQQPVEYKSSPLAPSSYFAPAPAWAEEQASTQQSAQKPSPYAALIDKIRKRYAPKPFGAPSP